MFPDAVTRRRLASVGFGLLAGFTALPFAGTYAGHLTASTTQSLDPTVVDSTLADASLTVTGAFDFVLRTRVIRTSVASEGVGDE